MNKIYHRRITVYPLANKFAKGYSNEISYLIYYSTLMANYTMSAHAQMDIYVMLSFKQNFPLQILFLGWYVYRYLNNQYEGGGRGCRLVLWA
jgi:hypothetical protein